MIRYISLNVINNIFSLIMGILSYLYLGSNLDGDIFGVIGIFILMQNGMAVLDFGFTPMLSRKIPILLERGKLDSCFPSYLRTFEWFVLFMGGCFILAFALAKDSMIEIWFHELADSGIDSGVLINLIFWNVLARWYSSVYKGVLLGFKNFDFVNRIYFCFNLFRFCVIPFLTINYNLTIDIYLILNLIVNVLEFFANFSASYILNMSTLTRVKLFHFDFEKFKDGFKLSTSIAYSAIVWVIVSQLDKFVLSTTLDLETFGNLSLVLLVASVLIKIGPPISQIVGIYLAGAFAQDARDGTSNGRDVYLFSLNFVMLLSIYTSINIIFYAPILFTVLDIPVEVRNISNQVLYLYVIGNSVIPIASICYQFQIGIGKMKLNIVGSTLNMLFQVPIIYFSVHYFGIHGAAWAWCLIRVIWFFFWTALVHAVYLKDFNIIWFRSSVVPSFVCMAILAVVYFLISLIDNGLLSFILALIVSTLVGIAIVWFAFINKFRSGNMA